MDSKKQIIKDDQINKLFDFLSDAYQKTRKGYTRLSMSELAKINGIATPSKVLTAVKSLELIKHRGGRRNSMWYWGQGIPNREMAVKTYNEMHRIATNNRIKNETDKKIKSKKLVPIIKQAKIIDVLNSMYENKGEILSKLSYEHKYGLSQNVIQSLIDLDVLSEHDRAKGLYIWMFGKPDNTLIDLIKSEVQEVKRNPVNNFSKSKAKRVAHQAEVVKFLRRVEKSGFVGSPRHVLKESGLNQLHLGVMIDKGFVKNTGTRTKPVYVASNVTDEMGEIVVKEVADIWKKTSRARRNTKSTNSIKSPVPVTEIKSTLGNQPTSLEKAIAKKLELEKELEKLNSYIKAAKEMESLAAELNL